MVEMTRAASVSRLRSEYDNFLFAPISTDKNGMLLSVLSALARLDLDPWQEAASLARLPEAAATQRLVSLIAATPDGLSAPTEHRMVAARLIALLPRRSPPSIPLHQALLGIRAMSRSQAIIYAMVILAALVLGAEWYSATRPSSAPAGFTHTSASSTTSSRNSLPPAGNDHVQVAERSVKT